MMNIAKPLRLAALSVAIGMCIVSTAHAQSNTTGSIFGVAPTEPGTTIVIQNLDTGQTRTLTADKAGKYRASSLQSGRYKVTLQKDGTEISSRDDVAVIIASGTEVSFVNASGIQELEGVQVTASAAPQIDVSQVDTRSVFTAETLSRIALPRDIASVALLAPGVVRNDSYVDATGVTIPSFGGAASSENAYYINGYPVTNPLTAIGFTTLPFDAISQEQVLTGGYGAEFGRSTGGVINIVTKRGSNEWKGGAYTIWTPEGLRASPRNMYFPNTGFYGPGTAPENEPASDGTLYRYRNKNLSWLNTTGAYVSGAIIPDRLFIYANAELTRQRAQAYRATRRPRQEPQVATSTSSAISRDGQRR